MLLTAARKGQGRGGRRGSGGSDDEDGGGGEHGDGAGDGGSADEHDLYVCVFGGV